MSEWGVVVLVLLGWCAGMWLAYLHGLAVGEYRQRRKHVEKLWEEVPDGRA